MPFNILSLLAQTLTLLILLLPAYACRDNTEAPANAPALQKTDADGMLFVPAGNFLMGSSSPVAGADEKPQHTVFVSDFYIDRYEVTNRQYQRFIRETGRAAPHVDAAWASAANWNGTDFPAGKAQYPVVLVSWHDAMAYARWSGKRLPTEAEWEKAARAGLRACEYPYGNRLELQQANYFKGYIRGKQLKPVGSFAPSGRGLYDMAGNVWEWCQDWYSASYYSDNATADPQGPANGAYKVFRGGAWNSDVKFLRCAERGKNSPDHKSTAVGFRCARSADQP